MWKSVRVATKVLVASSAGLLLGCGGDNGGGTEPNPSRIQATVLLDGSAESGVTVRLFNSGGTTAVDQGTTGGNGQVVFDDLDNGTYDVEVVVPTGTELDTGESARKPVTVAAGATSTVSFDLVTLGGGGGEDVEVELLAASFSPATVTISTGSTVTWRNANAITHTITPEGHSEWSEQTLTQSGETFSHTFNTAGSFPYECTIHAGMTGTVTVE